MLFLIFVCVQFVFMVYLRSNPQVIFMTFLTLSFFRPRYDESVYVVRTLCPQLLLQFYADMFTLNSVLALSEDVLICYK